MSIEIINYKGHEIIYYNLTESREKGQEQEQLDELNEKIEKSLSTHLVLINVSNYMPGNNYMELATKSLYRRANKIRKAAYVGINSNNQKMYEKFNKFNTGIVNRQLFGTIELALEWLIS
jgi:hypothetical protein